jgi:hypothetical protein
MKRLVPLVLLVLFGISACATVGSGPRIINTEVLDSGAVTITWASSKSVSYQVLSADDPTAPPDSWTVEATVTATGSKTSWTDDAAAGVKAKLYRVKALDETE